MNKAKIIATLLTTSLLLTACTANTVTSTGTPTSQPGSGSITELQSPSATLAPQVNVEDASSAKVEINSDFTITGEGVSTEAGTCTITQEGEYTLSGLLNGNIIIDAGEEAKVTLVLNGICINSASAAPIYVSSADKVTIKAAEGTYNEINDKRAVYDSSATDTESTPANGVGAITAKADLTISGKGSLVVTGNYKNGIHTSKDLTVKNLTLKVTAENNALKGKDSISINDASVIAIAFSGDAIKSENSDLSSKNNQRGTITIESSNIEVFAACDGISAAYDLIISGSSNITVKTSSYSEYSKPVTATTTTTTTTTGSFWGGFGGHGGFGGGNSNKTDYSSKGLKAGNSITVSDGTIYIYTKDDGLHAKSEALENGSNGAGLVTIEGGQLVITVSDDGIHADSVLNIKGGEINVLSSYEGLEANTINISGGATYVQASDDGVNASSGTVTPSINISGGYLDVTTSTGDTDGIDSNGTYTQTGGFVIIKGGSSQGGMAGSLDADRTVTVTGGTIIAFGGICELPTNSQNGYASSGTSFSAGTYVLTDSSNNTLLTVTLPASYSSVWLSSDALQTGMTYTLSKDSTKVLSWTQTEGQMGSSGMGGGFGPGGGQGGTRPGGQGGFPGGRH